MKEHVIAAIVIAIGALPLFVLGFYFRGERGPRLLAVAGKKNLRDPRALATFIGNGLLRIGVAHLPFAASLPFLTESQSLMAALVFAVVVVALVIHFIIGVLNRQSS
jgi:hypothetical protein